jgi:hypothetical protein
MPPYNPNTSATITLLARDEWQSPQYGPNGGIDNEYQLVEGVAVLPVAETPPSDDTQLASWSPVDVIRLHAPYRVRTARVSATKSNTPPVLPTPKSQGSFKFLGGNMVFPSPSLNSGLSAFDWKAEATYQFVENCVSRPQDGFVLGQLSFTYQTQVENLAAWGNPIAPQFGAVATAGKTTLCGYYAATLIDTYANQNWTYCEPSYWPGTIFNDGMLINKPDTV